MSSSSVSMRKHYYEAFINFRGADTRQGFVSILRSRMENAGIWFFYDDQSIPKCEVIAEELRQAINVSHIYITIFSERYADSKWPLRELAQMNDLRKSNGKLILPIFYDVEVEALKLRGDINNNAPEEHRRTVYTKALEVHRQNGVDAKTLEDWTTALKEVARLKGLELLRTGQTEFCDQIVAVILDKLKDKCYMHNHIIGLEGRVNEIAEQLQLDSSDVRFLVIHGPRGAGKTTLAKHIFKQFSTCFEGHSFIADIGSQQDGYKYLEKHLLLDILGKEEGEGKSIKQCFRRKNVLIVLDNVETHEQLKKMQSTWFGPGSRIIITAERGAAAPMQVKDQCLFYEMTGMDRGNARRLFSRRAFGIDDPPRDYDRMTSNIMPYIEQLPLTIEIVGSYLRKKSVPTWLSTTNELIGMSQTPEVVATQMIEKSFKELKDQDEKPIFLDIACFFVNKEKTNAMYMWKHLYPNAEAAVQNLVAASLVKIENDKYLLMHDLVREFGQNIVLAEAVGDPGQRSRLWKHKEALRVLERQERKEKVEGLCLSNSEFLKGYSISGPQMEMRILRFFRLYFGTVSGNLRNLVELRWLSWNHSPNHLAAKSFSCVKLVILDLSDSFVTHEWTGWGLLQGASELKVLDVTRCKKLKQTPNLSNFRRLERLILEGCSALAIIDDSIRDLGELKYLNAKGCDSLVGLPDGLGSLTALTELVISKTKRSVSDQANFTLPESIRSWTSLLILELVNLEIHQLPSVEELRKLHRLSLSGCSAMNQLPPTIGRLESLVELDISHTNIHTLPDSIGDLHKLEVMKMENSSVTTLPSSIWMLENLKELYARNCKSLQGNILDLGSSDVETIISPSLRILDLTSTGDIRLSGKVSELSLLQMLHLDSWHQVQSLVSLPSSLTSLHIRLADDIQNLLSKVNNLVDLVIFHPADSPPSMQIPWRLLNLAKLKMLKLSGGDLEHWSVLPSSLSKLVLENVKVGLHDTPSHLTSMSYLELSSCTIAGNSFAIEGLTSLVHFTVDGCRFAEVKLLRPPEHLRVLRVNHCRFGNTVLDVSGLKHLQQLELQNCNETDLERTWMRATTSFFFDQKRGLNKIQGLDNLGSLQELSIKKCRFLEKLNGITNLETLQTLYLDINQGVLTEGERETLNNNQKIDTKIICIL